MISDKTSVPWETIIAVLTRRATDDEWRQVREELADPASDTRREIAAMHAATANPFDIDLARLLLVTSDYHVGVPSTWGTFDPESWSLDVVLSRGKFGGVESGAEAAFSGNVGVALYRLAGECSGKGQLDDADRLYRSVIASIRQEAGDDTPCIGSILVNLGNVHVARQDLSTAEIMLLKALTILEKDCETFGADLASLLNGLGMVLNDTGRPEGAQAYLLRATDLAFAHEMDFPDQSLLGCITTNLSLSQLLLGRFEEAVKSAIAGVAHFQRSGMGEHAFALNARNNCAVGMQQSGGSPEAERILRSVIEIARRKSLVGHEVMALTNLAVSLESRGDEKAAENFLRKALELLDKDGQRNDRAAAVVDNNRAVLLQKKGRFEEALALYSAASKATNVAQQLATILSNLQRASARDPQAEMLFVLGSAA